MRFVKTPDEIRRIQKTFARCHFLATRNLTVVFETTLEIVRQLLPPPLEPTPEPLGSAWVGQVENSNCVGPFLGAALYIKARYKDIIGNYCVTMPMSTSEAVIFGRELYGEPKKLAQLDFSRDGNHVHASVTRQGVTIIEIVGNVTATLPTPPPYPLLHFWYKFLPAVSGKGFDAGPFLITLHQTMKPESCERVEGKLVLGDLPGTPVADLPILEQESMRYMMTSSEFFHVLEDVDIDPDEYAKHVAIQYR